MGKTLFQLFMALALLGLLFFFAYLSSTSRTETAGKQIYQDSNQFNSVQSDFVPSEELLPEDMIYGFVIGDIHIAYPVSDFVGANHINDTIAGENVILGPTESGIIMTHTETGEVFIPIKTEWLKWSTLYPDTLIYKNE